MLWTLPLFLVGYERKLRNAVYKCMQKYPSVPHPLAPTEAIKEPVTYIRRAQVNAQSRLIYH